MRLLLSAILILLLFAVSRGQPSQASSAPSPVDSPRPTTAPESPIDWSVYSRSDSFEFFRRMHSSAYNLSTPLGDSHGSSVAAVVAITWFLRDGVALQYAVNANGKEWDCRQVYDAATQASHDNQLDAARLRELTGALSKLPASTTPPPLANLVIVSRQAGAVWRTDVYDSRKLPSAMESVMAIIGERFETRERQKTTQPAEGGERGGRNAN
jgi:hypothetical protein